MTINRFCSSGLQAIAIAAGAIAIGLERRRRRRRRRVDDDGADDRQQAERLARGDARGAPTVYTPMGITAENVAKRFSDLARRPGRLRPAQPAEGGGGAEGGRVRAGDRRGARRRATTAASASTSTFKRDELVRARHDAEGLAALKPAFSKDGSVTAGNTLAALRRRGRGARDEQGEGATRLGVKPLGVVPRVRDGGRRPGHHGHRPHPGGAQAPRQDGPLGRATSISSR